MDPLIRLSLSDCVIFKGELNCIWRPNFFSPDRIIFFDEDRYLAAIIRGLLLGHEIKRLK